LLLLVVLTSLVLIASCGYKPTMMEKESGWLYADILQIANNQANRAFGSLNGGFPTHTSGDGWVDDADFNWARGYYPGLLWLIYQGAGDTTAVNLASAWMPSLAPLKWMDDRAGLGMVFYPSYVTAYQITGNRDYRQVALDAAEVASKRYTQAGYFPAWGAAGDTVLSRRLSIQTLMDLDLLYWASEASGNPVYERQATSHAIFTITRLIDGTGRILHVADFDPITGAIFGERTPELADNPMYSTYGYNASTVWAQGQAWAIYGLASAYKHDQQPLFLNAATRAADYLVAHLPDDGVPFWDFELPAGADKQKDTAAAAVAAAGLMKLSRITAAPDKKALYRQTAARIITQLNNSYLKAEQTGILRDGVWSKQGSSPLSGGTSWGDYYYIEALLLLQDIKA
jgi:unsaturated chondroitin disaccharide hydrolase